MVPRSRTIHIKPFVSMPEGRYTVLRYIYISRFALALLQINRFNGGNTRIVLAIM